MKVNREELIAELATLKPALASGGVVQELSHIWFDDGYLYAYDGGFGIKRKSALAVGLSCGVPGTALLSLLGTSTLKEIELEASDKDLKVKMGKSNSKLAALPIDRIVWPFPAKLPNKTRPTELDEAFIEGLRKTLFVKASKPTRVEHHGIMLVRSKEDLDLYSTDSATMVRVIVLGAGNGASVDRTLLPRGFAEEVVSQSPEGVKLYALDDCLIAEAEKVTFYSNVLDISTADDMGAIVEGQLKKHGGAVSELPAGLDSTLARAEILAGAEEALVEASLDGSALKLVGNYRLGALNESLPLEKKLSSAKLRVQADKLRLGLVHAEAFSLTKDSLVLRGGSDFVYVVAAK